MRTKLEEQISQRKLHEQAGALMKMAMAAGILAFDEVTAHTAAHHRMDYFIDSFTAQFQKAIDNPLVTIERAEERSGVQLDVEVHDE